MGEMSRFHVLRVMNVKRRRVAHVCPVVEQRQPIGAVLAGDPDADPGVEKPQIFRAGPRGSHGVLHRWGLFLGSLSILAA